MTSISVSNVFKTIWRRPSQTFEAILADSNDPEIDQIAMPFFIVSGIGGGLDNASLRNLGDKIESLPLLIGLASLGGIFSAFLGLYLYLWLFKHTNKWFGGTGDADRIKTALLWGMLPFAATALLWIPSLLLIGMDNFTESMPRVDSNSTLFVLWAILLLIELGLLIYCYIIWLKGIGRACGFSAWKALKMSIVSTVLILLPIVAIILLIVFINR